MELRGILKEVRGVEVLKNDFRKRQIVLETNERYPQMIPIDFIGDKVSMLDNVVKGQEVSVMINITGREWADPTTGEVKYFVSIVGWKLNVIVRQSVDVPPPTYDMQKMANNMNQMVSPPPQEAGLRTDYKVNEPPFEMYKGKEEEQDFEDDLPF